MPRAAYERGQYSGIGYSLDDGDVALDLDKCRNPETGEIDDWAFEIFEQSQTYCELTPSGTGARGIGIGAGPKLNKNLKIPDSADAHLEIYRSADRYITVTGLQITEYEHCAPRNIDAVADGLLQAFGGKPQTDANLGEVNGHTVPPGDLPLPDEDDLNSALMVLLCAGFEQGKADRSAVFHQVVTGLRDENGLTPAQIETLMRRYPNGIAEKYNGRLRKMIEASWCKVRNEVCDVRKEENGDVVDHTNGQVLYDAGVVKEPGADTEQPKRGERILNVVDAGLFEGKAITPREWHAPGLIPARTVTLLSGDGGVGKSLLALQLCASTVLSTPWCGLSVAQGPAVFLTAEDEIDELHRRLDDIVCGRYSGLTEKLWLISLCDEDALFAVPDRDGRMTPTKLYEAVRRVLIETKPKLLVLDTAADIFGGDEIKRKEVRGFIAMLRKLAIEFDCAIVLLSHPSQSGMSSGAGSSGSTAWNNSVRSRLYFVHGPEGDKDVRVLNSKKSNYGPVGASITLRYVSGSFVVADGEGLACADPKDQAKRVDEIFMNLIDVFEKRSVNVSNAVGPTFAPAQFAKDPLSKGVSKQSLLAAMNRLLDAGEIIVDEFGTPSRMRTRLIRKPVELVRSADAPRPWPRRGKND